ncbi:hypothetical protein ACQP1G_40990 [Nocardia sp. CA-107356]|uniref:hypothetical protein n=1 Tax=Nocardia sp. CA-107356 TaxID=3239972 RepID=UPI003D8D16D1
MAMPFKRELTERTAAAIRRCTDAGSAPADDPVSVMLDLRAAVHGAVSMRLNEPGRSWPPLADQIELVGIAPISGRRPTTSFVTEFTAAANLRPCGSLLCW